MLSKLPVGVRVENYLRIGSKVHQNIKQGLYLKSANLFFTDFIIVAVRPQVEVSGHTTLEEFVNAGFISPVQPSFSKTLFIPEHMTGGIWKRQLCVLVWTENVLETVSSAELFEEELSEFSSNTNPKWPVSFAFSYLSGVIWMELACSRLSVVGKLDYQPLFGKWARAPPPSGRVDQTRESGGNRA